MSEDVLAADASLAELARLRTSVRDLREINAQQQRALDAERAARRVFEADATQLRQTALAYVQATTYEARERLRAELHVLATVEHPGVLLLRELDAARALAAYLNDRRHWRMGGICPTCGFGKKLNGDEFHGTGCPLDAYNATLKAGGE
jgi:hypothetical protein